MHADPHSIPARILIDPADLATLRSASTPDIAPLLERVAGLLGDVRSRLDGDSRVLIDQIEAARLMGCSAKTLQNHGIPHVSVGSRRMYRPEALRQWAADRESTSEPAGVTR
jgi:hypothetical protein